MLLLFRGEYALKEYTEVKTVSDIILYCVHSWIQEAGFFFYMVGTSDGGGGIYKYKL